MYFSRPSLAKNTRTVFTAGHPFLIQFFADPAAAAAFPAVGGRFAFVGQPVLPDQKLLGHKVIQVIPRHQLIVLPLAGGIKIG